MGKTSAAVKNKWNGENYDRIALMVPKGKKEEYKARAEENGESLNGYINRLLEQDLEDNKPL